MELFIIAVVVVIGIVMFKAFFKAAIVITIILVGFILISGISPASFFDKSKEVIDQGKQIACPEQSIETAQKLALAKREAVMVRKALENPNITPDRKSVLNKRLAKLDTEILRLRACD